MRHILIFILAVLIFLPASCQKNSQSDELLKKLLAQYEQSVNSKDYLGFLSCFDTGYIDPYFSPEIARKNIKNALSASLSPVLEIKEQKITFIAKDRAKVFQNFHLEGVMFGKPRQYDEQETLVLRRTPKGWGIISGSVLYQILAGRPLEEDEIKKVLEKRADALREKNLELFKEIVAKDYNFNGKTFKQVIEEMKENFEAYDKIELELGTPTIRLYDGKADVVESYSLRAWYKGEKIEFNDREKLQLKKTKNGWKISRGL